MAKKKAPTKVGPTNNPLQMKIAKGQPGFANKPTPGVSPAVARELFAKKDVRAKSLREFKKKTAGGSAIQAFAAAPGVASNTVATPAMTIAELARALKNDADLMFYHVYNNIDFHPTFGLQKGSLGVMIDGIGNAFDQCQLLVDLLTEAGYTASFLFGDLDLSQDEISGWLGTDSSSIWNSYYLLANGGIPCDAVWTGTEYRMTLSHVWVKVTIDSVDYVLDPAYKTYSTTTGMNLATAMSYSQSSFLDAADDGATVDTDYVQDVNAGNIATELATYTDNLIDYIKTNNPTATMDDVLGGRSIVKIDTPVRQTVHPKQADTPTGWTSIPNAYRITVRFQCDTIDETLYGDELHGRRVTVFFNGSNEGELRVDGTLIDATGAQTTGGGVSMQITVTHPYSVTWYDQTIWQWLRAPFSGGGQAYYLIGTVFGVTNRSLYDYHVKQYQINDFAGGGATSEPVLGELLAVRWSNYLGQLFTVSDILGRMMNCTRNEHHHIGLCYLEDYPSIDVAGFDIQGAMGTTSSLDGDSASMVKFGTALAMHGYCLEMLATQQVTGNEAISATRVLEEANANGDKIYKATDSNWTSVSSSLSGYGSGDLSNIAFYTSNDWFVLVPEAAPTTIGSFDCTAYGALSPNGGAIGIINSTFGAVGPNGPFFPWPWFIPIEDDELEPVGRFTGSFKYRQLDLSVGSSKFPYKLGFESHYSSAHRLKSGTQGLGWSHNWQISVKESSDGFRGLGSESPIDGAASIVELFVCLDMLDDTDYPVLNLVSASLCNSWWADQLTNNIAVIDGVERTRTFTKLPDGTYNPQHNVVSTFVKNMDGTYTLTSKRQVVMEFDSDGTLSTWEFPYGVTISLTYSSGKLTGVSNGMGRSLTLNYTGDKLTSVEDDSSRTVSYEYDMDDQLVTFTDAAGEDVTFEYDEPGRMEKYYLPANPTAPMVTNTYDSLDRIESQLDPQGNESSMYIAGWRTEIENELGNGRVFEYNKRGKVTKFIDALGFETTCEYDGLDRRVLQVMPEGNSIAWTYDELNNILTVTRSPKPGSSLDDIVETFTYHSTFNKVLTYEDGRGNTTTYSYDASTGSLLTKERPEVDSETPTVTYTYNGRGQVLTREDPTGIVRAFEYDSTTEALEQVTVDDGMGGLNLVTAFTYHGWGDIETVEDARGNTTTFTVDDKRRLTQIEAPSPFGYLTKLTWDENNNLIKVERQTGDVSHPWQTVEATYNYACKQLTLKDPLNNVTTRQYDVARRLWKVTDPESRITTFSYDARNKLATVTDPASNVVVTRTYTANGRLATIEDGRGNLTEFTYDGFDRPEKTIYPDGTFEQIDAYDGNSNVLSKTTRAGETIAFELDVLNRLIEKSPDDMPTVTYVYDLAGRLLSFSTPVVAGNPASGEWELTYDTAGRFVSEEAPDGKTVTLERDENGNVVKVTYPDSYYVDRVFDELNRLTDIKLNGATTAAAHFDYDELSRRTAVVFDNSTQIDYDYEWNNDISTIEQSFNGDSLDFAYGYNDAHQLISQTISDADNSWHPTVDSTTDFGDSNELNQYPYATGSCGRLYKGYDENGCLIDDGVWNFGYDTESHLISASDGITSASYVYEPKHRQIQKDVDGTKTRYVYSGYRRIADYNGTSDTLQNRYVYGPRMDEPLITVASTGDLTYMYHDRVGSIVALADDSGNVTNRYAYSPYGESNSLSGTTFGYTGQRFDEETGLYFYKTRYYSPKLGRFLQPDPLRYGAGLNMYQYVKNDPFRFTDPMGLVGMSTPGGIQDLSDFINRFMGGGGTDGPETVYIPTIFDPTTVMADPGDQDPDPDPPEEEDTAPPGGEPGWPISHHEGEGSDEGEGDDEQEGEGEDEGEGDGEGDDDGDNPENWPERVEGKRLTEHARDEAGNDAVKLWELEDALRDPNPRQGKNGREFYYSPSSGVEAVVVGENIVTIYRVQP